MRKLIAPFAAIVAVLSFLTACSTDPSTEDWLKNTVWKAPLEGIVYSINPDNPDGTLSGDQIRLYISGSRIKMTSEAVGDNTNYSSSMATQAPIDYHYPTIGIPYPVQKPDDEMDAYYNTGTISEDLKSIHFDVFIIPSPHVEWGYSLLFRDITFYR